MVSNGNYSHGIGQDNFPSFLRICLTSIRLRFYLVYMLQSECVSTGKHSDCNRYKYTYLFIITEYSMLSGENRNLGRKMYHKHRQLLAQNMSISRNNQSDSFIF